MNPEQVSDQVFHLREWNLIRPVAERDIGIGVDLHEESLTPGCHCCFSQGRHILPLAAGYGSTAASKLHAVCSIKYNRNAFALNHGDRAEIDDQIVVTECGTTLGNADVRIA